MEHIAEFDPTRILYNDDDLIAVNKPAGALVVADRWGKETNILLHQVGTFLRAHGHTVDASGRDIYPVHRLDRDTSGVVVFAKHREAHRQVSRLFETRDVDKRYWLIAGGCPPHSRFQVDAPLSRREGKRGRGRGYVDHAHGKPATTEFRVLQCFADVSWLAAHPITGRTHQIRLHAAAAGFPALVDPQYGRTSWMSPRFGELILPRVPLHARELTFTHPRTQQTLRIEAPLDADLQEFLLRLADATGATLAWP